MSTWDKFFLDLAATASTKSKDRSTKVGALFASQENDILCIGWNGFPRGVQDDFEPYHDRPLKYKITEHAERNAIYNAARLGLSLKGSKLYVSFTPCTDCARGIIQVGCTEVITDPRWVFAPGVRERWEDDAEWSEAMFEDAGVSLRMGTIV